MTKEAKNKKRSPKRLGPGELDGLVLAHLRKHKADGPLTASAIRKGWDALRVPWPTVSAV